MLDFFGIPAVLFSCVVQKPYAFIQTFFYCVWSFIMFGKINLSQTPNAWTPKLIRTEHAGLSGIPGVTVKPL